MFIVKYIDSTYIKIFVWKFGTPIHNIRFHWRIHKFAYVRMAVNVR